MAVATYLGHNWDHQRDARQRHDVHDDRGANGFAPRLAALGLGIVTLG